MKNKRIIFEITHPKHFHQFKNLMKAMGDQNQIMILARNKDVVLDLIKTLDIQYYTYNDFGKGIVNKFLLVPGILLKYISVFIRFRPDVVISRSSPYSALLSRMFRFKSVIFPDSEVVSLTKKFVAPLADLIITPDNYTLDYGKKHHRLSGFFEESYLSPTYFKADDKIRRSFIGDSDEKVFFLRFVSWQANHDLNQFGFRLDQKIKLVHLLTEYGRVIISSEKTIEKELEEYRLEIPPQHIHHILSGAWLYVGDSQSMATEAALLGVPSLRCNSFVGENDMSNFIKLEKELDLLYNFNDFENLFAKIQKLIENPNLKAEWTEKRTGYFENSGDINQKSLEIISVFIGK